MTWRDANGMTLADYPRPSLAVDVALLTVVDGSLRVLLHLAEGDWSLPGTFVREQERLAEAALRALATKVGVTGEAPEQLGVFDDPARDERGRVVSVAHVDLVPASRLPGAELVPVDGLPPLRFDHDAIVAAAVRWARSLYAAAPDPRGLLGEEFTLHGLRGVHAAIQGAETPAKDAFRRRMAEQVEPVGRVATGAVGKPAQLFRRAPRP